MYIVLAIFLPLANESEQLFTILSYIKTLPFVL